MQPSEARRSGPDRIGAIRRPLLAALLVAAAVAAGCGGDESDRRQEPPAGSSDWDRLTWDRDVWG